MLFLLYLSEVINKKIGANIALSNSLQVSALVIVLMVTVFTFLCVPLIADKKQTAFQAIGNSIRLLSRQWYKVLGILLIMYVFMMVAAIPLLVGMIFHHPIIQILGMIIIVVAFIWLLPFNMMLQANVYLKLAGPNQGS